MESIGIALAFGGIAYFIYQGIKKNAEIEVDGSQTTYAARIVDPSNELRNPSHMQYGRNLSVKSYGRGQFGSPLTTYVQEDGTEIKAYGQAGQNNFTRTSS
jgi:hypothetical protein